LKVQAETLAVKTKVLSDERLVAALIGEAGDLGRQATIAEEEARGHRAEQYRAVADGLQTEWDIAVDRLADIGARLVGAHGRLGHPVADLWQLCVPLFQPGRPPLGIDDLDRREEVSGD
jgi:hypothetical protein